MWLSPHAGDRTGPNEPQTAAGRWGASASYYYVHMSLLLLLSLSSSPSFLLSVCHFSDSSAAAKTTACYLRSDQHVATAAGVTLLFCHRDGKIVPE